MAEVLSYSVRAVGRSITVYSRVKVSVRGLNRSVVVHKRVGVSVTVRKGD